ncbi:hypothetical protein AB4Z01_35070 [Inquilinus sp. YAF38]|uniref:hypothetical protein n=1 Tax=Inquilinus sp. YAF38 TaxID=3233084 RepID=UPI003F8DBE45
MRDGLLDRITENGYWRVNVRPLQPLDNKLLLAQCREIVEKSRVSLRGWDYPHISHDSEHGGNDNGDEFAQNWCDWYHHIEFWRMYRSSQFLHYKALTEDIRTGTQRRPKGRVISVIGAIWFVTEVVEFVRRLSTRNLYSAGVELSITLGNTENRQLWMDDDRVPFFDTKMTTASSIVIDRKILSDSLEGDAIDESNYIAIELFDRFGWNPDQSLIRSDQNRLFRKQF